MASKTRQRQGRDFSDPSRPENYLKNAEMAVEGNYNQIDGIIGNAQARGMDLTDGQTWEEMRELAPDTLPEEKYSVLERLKELAEQAKAAAEPVDGHEPPGLERD